jgi:N-acetylglutamate synthase-like GNAT family acetyltransferase
MRTIADLTYTPAGPGDAPAIAELLRAADLPDGDFAPHLAHFLVARDERGAVIGAVGAEVCAPDALLRSLVVAPAWRGAGVGGGLVRRLEEAAGAWGVGRWWLLTTTAEAFFRAQGFVEMPRAAAPPAIRGTGQFSGGCCGSAVCLTRERRNAT